MPRARLPSRFVRAGYRVALAAAVIFIGCDSLQNAVANGDTRTISMHHVHSGESLTITYKRDGRYDEDALKKISWLLRDWRRNEAIRMDPQLIDLVSDVTREVDAKSPIEVIGGYRAPATNKLLRSRSSGVAEHSQHMSGHAMDFYVPGVPLAKLREVGLRFQRGGVGFYPTSGSPFVHMDVGSVRHWPRMTHDQLVRVFPDGRTVHVPSDGHPLRGYALALADLQRRGRHPNGVSLAAARRDGVNVAAVEAAAPKNTLASLFGFGDSSSESADASKSDASKSDASNSDASNSDASKSSTSKANAGTVVANTIALPRTKPLGAPATIDVAENAPPLPRSRPSFQLAAASPPATAVQIASALPMALAKPQQDDADTILRLAYAPLPDADMTGRDTSLPERQVVRLPRVAPGFKTQTVRTVSSTPAGTTVVAPSTIITSSFVAATSQVGKAGQTYEDPWLRAAILTPSMSAFMSLSSLSQDDPRGLTVFMGPPTTVLAMTFSRDPRSSLASHAFTGKAVTFVATLPHIARTASLY